MRDCFDNELKVSDTVFYLDIGNMTLQDSYPKKYLAKIIEIQPTETKIEFADTKRMRWAGNTLLELATPEKLFLYHLENA